MLPRLNNRNIKIFMRDIFEFINEANTTFEVDISMDKKELELFQRQAKQNGFDIKMTKNRYSDVAVIKGDKQK